MDTRFVCHQVNVSTGERKQVHYLTIAQGDELVARKAQDRVAAQAEQVRVAKYAAMMAYLEQVYDNRNNTMSQPR